MGVESTFRFKGRGSDFQNGALSPDEGSRVGTGSNYYYGNGGPQSSTLQSMRNPQRQSVKKPKQESSLAAIQTQNSAVASAEEKMQRELSNVQTVELQRFTQASSVQRAEQNLVITGTQPGSAVKTNESLPSAQGSSQ